MEVLYLLLPLALGLVALAVAAFIWATRAGQLDDLDTPAIRVLFDAEERQPPGEREGPPAGQREGAATRPPQRPARAGAQSSSG